MTFAETMIINARHDKSKTNSNLMSHCSVLRGAVLFRSCGVHVIQTVSTFPVSGKTTADVYKYK